MLSACADPWWLLGSAAIALSGIDPNGVRDLDVLVSPADADRLMARHKLANDADGGNLLFRSDTLLLPDLGQVPVEIMSNYFIKAGATWKLLTPKTRVRVKAAEIDMFVPEISEQIEILMALGRPKDFARVELLRSKA